MWCVSAALCAFYKGNHTHILYRRRTWGTWRTWRGPPKALFVLYFLLSTLPRRRTWGTWRTWLAPPRALIVLYFLLSTLCFRLYFLLFTYTLPTAHLWHLVHFGAAATENRRISHLAHLVALGPLGVVKSILMDTELSNSTVRQARQCDYVECRNCRTLSKTVETVESVPLSKHCRTVEKLSRTVELYCRTVEPGLGSIRGMAAHTRPPGPGVLPPCLSCMPSALSILWGVRTRHAAHVLALCGDETPGGRVPGLTTHAQTTAE